jgi:hypothetical protein
MPFNEKLPNWQNEGTEPPESKKAAGFLPGEKPPADWFNWLFARLSKVVAEIRLKAAMKEDIDNHKNASTLDHPDGSVKTSKVADKAITQAKIADKAVGAGQIADAAISDTILGNRTATDSVTPSLNGSLTALLSSIFTLIKGITGKSNALTAPAITLEAAKSSIDELKAAQTEAATITAPIKRGLSVINTSQASPIEYTVQGRTLVNLLGRDGSFEVDSNGDGVANGFVKSNPGVAALDSVNALYGSKSQRISSVASDSSMSRMLAYLIATENTKRYIALVDAFTDGVSTARFHIFDTISGANYDSKSTTTSKTLTIKFTATVNPTSINLWNYNAVGVIGSVWFDGLRLYEVSAADYAKIDVDPEWSGEKLVEKFPYVDSVQHLQAPSVRKKGRNLLPPFTTWTLHANAKALGPYELELIASANYQYSEVTIQVVPLTTYTLSNSTSDVTLNTVKQIILRDAKGAYTRTVTGTFTTNATEVSATLQIGNGAVTSGTYKFSDLQIEVGAAKTQFQAQNDDYVFLPTPLASDIDGSVRDTYNSALGTVTRRWKPNMVLDGSFAWIGATIGTGLKFFYAPSSPLAKGGAGSLTRPDGSIAKHESSGLAANMKAGGFLISGAGNIYLAVANADSGWGDAFNPSNAELIAYMNGWQMNNGTLGTPYDGGATKKWTPVVSPKANFKDKIPNSLVANPHTAAAGAGAALIAPNGTWFEFSAAAYNQISILDGTTIASNSTFTNGSVQQHKVKLDLIEHVARKYNLEFSPSTTLLQKVLWLQQNIARLILHAYVNGSGPAGYKISVASRNVSSNTWNAPVVSNLATIAKVSNVIPAASIATIIDSDGFVNFNVYADAAGPLENPAVAPTLSASGSGSGLAAGTYYVHYAWMTNGGGETVRSPQSSIVITAGQNIVVTVPTLPIGADQANVYFGTATGVTKRQSNTKTTSYTQSAALVTNTADSPTTNTSVAPSVVNSDFFEWDVELNVATVPPGYSSKEYRPYMLDYQLATAAEETNVVEGAIGLQSGGNQIELLEGVIVREKIIPSLDTSANDRYYINEKGVVSFITDNPLKYKVDKILAVYRNGVEDKFWYPYINSNLQNGAAVRIEKYNYDPTAEYTVTYNVLDKHLYTSNIIDATVKYQTTLGGTVAKNTQDITDIKTQNDVQDWKLLLDEAYALNTRFDLLAHIGSRGFSHAIATQTEAGFHSIPDKIKIDGIEAGANKYVHPVSHPPSIITQDAGNRFVTDAEKAAWNAKAAQTDVGSITSLLTNNKSNTVAAINELFTSASNGKTAVAAAITGKGIPASGADTFAQLATKVSAIEDWVYKSGNIVQAKSEGKPSFGSTPTTIAVLEITKGGTFGIEFGLATSNTAFIAYAQIFKNEVAYGTLRYNNVWNTTAVYSEQFTFSTGDKVQIKAWVDMQGGAGGVSYVSNILVKSSLQIPYFSF